MAKTYATVIDAVEGILRDAFQAEEQAEKDREIKARSLSEAVGDQRHKSIREALAAAREAIGASTIPPPPSARSAAGLKLPKVKTGVSAKPAKDYSDAAHAPTMRPAAEGRMKMRLRLKKGSV